MKKIIISANVIWTITNFRKDLIKFLQSKGFKVIAVGAKDELSIDLESSLKELNIEFIEVDVDRKSMNPIKDLKYLIKLFFIYRSIKPLVVIHFTIKPNIYGSLAATFANINYINTINGLGSALIKDNILSKILKLMYKVALKNSKKVFVQNRDDFEFFKKLIGDSKLAIVPGSGVNVKSFFNQRVEDDKFRFLLVARLLKDKGVMEYIEAAKIVKQKYSNVEFLLAGQFDSGNPSAISKEYIDQNSEFVKYIGVTSDIREFFKLCDVVVLPSYREGLSRVLIEAASAYKPLIATNVAGCKDVVKDGYNGFLVKLKDVKSLADAMKKMINLDKKKLDEFKNNSREFAINNFDKDIVNKIYFKEIELIEL